MDRTLESGGVSKEVSKLLGARSVAREVAFESFGNRTQRGDCNSYAWWITSTNGCQAGTDRGNLKDPHPKRLC